MLVNILQTNMLTQSLIDMKIAFGISILSKIAPIKMECQNEYAEAVKQHFGKRRLGVAPATPTTPTTKLRQSAAVVPVAGVAAFREDSAPMNPRNRPARSP
jgi:hypothetical protein